MKDGACGEPIVGIDYEGSFARPLGEEWREYHGGPERPEDEIETGVPREQLVEWLKRLNAAPPGFHVHPKLHRVMEGRRQMASGEWTGKR